MSFAKQVFDEMKSALENDYGVSVIIMKQGLELQWGMIRCDDKSIFDISKFCRESDYNRIIKYEDHEAFKDCIGKIEEYYNANC